MVFLAIDLPKSLTVKSVVTITNGKLNAAQVSLYPYKFRGIATNALDRVIIIIWIKTRVKIKFRLLVLIIT